MFQRIRRRRAEERERAEMLRQHIEAHMRLADLVPPAIGAQQAAGRQPAPEPTPVADDFLPPDLRVPSRDEVEGRMMTWQWPLVIGGEVVACAECGAYRDWIIFSMRDEVWRRCRAGHQRLEPRLDVAWYNRNAGPADGLHATFEDGLRHLGH